MGPVNMLRGAEALTVGVLGGAIALTVGSAVVSGDVLPHPVKGDSDMPWLLAMATGLFGGPAMIWAGLEQIGTRSTLGVGLAVGGALLLGTGMTLMGRRSELAHADMTYGGPYGPGTEAAQAEYRRAGGR